jgi:hypothetical protein
MILNLNLMAMLLGMKMLNPQIRCKMVNNKMASNKMVNIKMVSEIHQHLEDAMIADQIATTAADALAEDDAVEVDAAAVVVVAAETAVQIVVETAVQIVVEAIVVGAMTIVVARDRRVDRRVVAHLTDLLLSAIDNRSRLISVQTRRFLLQPQHLPQHLRQLRLQRRLQRRQQNRSVDHCMAPQCV